jgi:hypothetical protein
MKPWEGKETRGLCSATQFHTLLVNLGRAVGQFDVEIRSPAGGWGRIRSSAVP